MPDSRCGTLEESIVVITNDQEWAVTQQRIRQFHELLLQLRRSETTENYALMAIAYLLELDKMNEEIRSSLARPLMQPNG
jgi:hypothetical protein